MITVPFVIAALWGYADAVWQTQINGMIVIIVKVLPLLHLYNNAKLMQFSL